MHKYFSVARIANFTVCVSLGTGIEYSQRPVISPAAPGCLLWVFGSLCSSYPIRLLYVIKECSFGTSQLGDTVWTHQWNSSFAFLMYYVFFSLPSLLLISVMWTSYLAHPNVSICTCAYGWGFAPGFLHNPFLPLYFCVCCSPKAIEDSFMDQIPMTRLWWCCPPSC